MSKKIVNPKIASKSGHSPHKGMPGKAVQAKVQPKTKSRTEPALAMAKGPSLLENRWLPLALMVFLLLFVSLLYFPVAFQHKSPPASDISQWRGAANKIIEYNESHADNALWTQSMFSGMPSYMISFPNRWPFFENLSKLTDKLINWRIFLLFIGALGVFLLLRFLGMDPLVAFFGAVAFMFSCHWLGLVEIGHNTKFRAIMYIPWVIWSLLYLRRKPGLLGLGLLATTLIVQLRENHPQISYYLYLFVGMYWLWQLIETIRSKDWKGFGAFTGLAVLAAGLTLLAVLNPYLSTMEYSHYTMRGGAGGLETSYAQGWSFHPLEILTLIIPDFYGGVSPNYWGYMPFTQIYNYFGLLVLGFGVLALLGRRHRRLAVFLAIASFVFLLMSFGSFTPRLSDLFLKYLPYFNKFRVPSMILTMVQIIAAVMAALGLDTVLSAAAAGNKRWSNGLFRAFWICGGVFLLWLVAAKSVFAGLNFTNAGEMAQLEAREMLSQLPMIKEQRLGLLYRSGIFSLLFFTVGLGLAYLHAIRKLPRAALVLLLTLVVFIDLYIYTGKTLKSDKLQAPQEHLDRFAVRDYDEFLLADKDNYRIYPIDQDILTGAQLPKPAGEWAYHHQTVLGYSAAKLSRYDNLLKVLQDSEQGPGEWRRYLMGVFSPGQDSLPRESRTPVLNMLSAKYFIHPDRLPYDSLLTSIAPVFEGAEGITVYRNNSVLPRAWFVPAVRKIAPADSILPLLRSESFDPRALAYVETDIKNVERPDSSWVRQTATETHKLGYDLYTDKPTFLVLSEIYYPAGWKAFLDGKEVTIHLANYVLRGIQVPAGTHKLELTFAPESYKKSVTWSLAGLLASLLALAAGLYLKHRKPRLAKAEAAKPNHDSERR
ncbi:MAG TPA: YfhO family protein [Candidatus Syntrophosphaera sp.]|nr:YfhO family protein [Candidatus Syntrophosphaera sp.]